MKRCFLFYISFMIIISIGGCSKSDDGWSQKNPPTKEEIEESNLKRKELGIRQIKDTWTFVRRGYQKIQWEDEKDGSSKQVEYDSDYSNIIWERDDYYSGRTYPCGDPDSPDLNVPEVLVIEYDYAKKEFSIHLVNEDGLTILATLEQADEILDKWGVKRL